MKKSIRKKKRGTPNGSDSCSDMGSPGCELIERAELVKLTSANLYKVLQYKNVCNRSKLHKKAQRVEKLVGIVTRSDLETLGFTDILVPRMELSAKDRSTNFSEKDLRKLPQKGKRFNVPVGGIDVHKEVLAVSVADQKGIRARKQFLNEEKGIEDLIRFFKHYSVENAALESTAEYWLKPFWKLNASGVKVLVANPLQTKSTQGKKTDKEDADRIALAFRDGRLKPSVVCTPDQYSMRKLSRAAFKKKQQATSSANRLNSMYETFGAAPWIKKLHESRRGIRIYYQTLEAIDQDHILKVLTDEYSNGPHQIRAQWKLKKRAGELMQFLHNMDISPNNRSLFGQNLEDYVNYNRVASEIRLKLIQFATEQGQFTDRFKQNLELLLTVPNVSLNTALMILIEIVDINFFWNPKGLARWAGLTPRVKQSGFKKKQSGHLHKAGNKWLRTAVWLSAENCYRHLKDSDEPIGTYIKRLFKERKKHYFVAITAGARKLLTYIYHVLTQQRPFDEIFKMKRTERLKKNQKRKLGKLQKILTHSTVPELLPIIATSLKHECYKFSEAEKQLAVEIALKLGVSPKGSVAGS